mgnify:CR=1 FL=1
MARKNSSVESQGYARRVRWFSNVRWFYVLAVAISGITAEIIVGGVDPEAIRDIALAGIALIVNGIFWYLVHLRITKPSHFLNAARFFIIFDIILITYLIYTKGGIESRSVMLYTVPILVTSVIFGRRSTYATAIAAALLYDLLLIFEHTGVIKIIGIAAPALHGDLGYLINSVIFFSAVMLIIAAIADFLTKLLKEQDEKLNEAVEAMLEAQNIAQIGSWVWNIKSNSVTWSDVVYKIFGLQPDGKLTYETYMQYVHPADKEMVSAVVSKAIKDGQPFSFHHRIKAADGKIRYLYSQGRVEQKGGEKDRLFGTVQDVTNRQETEDILKKRTLELEKLNKFMIGRELKMSELKKELDARKKESK